jgi:Na+/citrate or Na+/malate symporter
MSEGHDTLAQRWAELEAQLVERFGKKPDLNAILMLIGIQESGQHKKEYTKEEKQDLMHVAVCHLLSASGYYAMDRVDSEGWPHYAQLKSLPALNLADQENFIKDHVLLYFDQL